MIFLIIFFYHFLIMSSPFFFFFFFFNDTATTEIYTLSLHDALPICRARSLSRAWSGASTLVTWYQSLATTVSRGPAWALRTPWLRSAASRACAASALRNTPSDTAQR